MKSISDLAPCWFHAGEFSDSLALANLTGELEEYFDFFAKNLNAKLELRSKSTNITPLLKLKPSQNIIISFSLSSESAAKEFDHKCPAISKRLEAIKKLVQHGYKIGIHFDPIIYSDNFEEDYTEITNRLISIVPNQSLAYISIGVVRFTSQSMRETETNYPSSKIFKQELIKSFDGKYRYNRPMRMWMMQKIKSKLIHFYSEEKIYLCME